MKSKLRNAFVGMLLVFTLSGVSLGQSTAATGEEEEAAKSYVQSYFIVGLGITLGIVAICKSAGRRKKVKAPE